MSIPASGSPRGGNPHSPDAARRRALERLARRQVAASAGSEAIAFYLKLVSDVADVMLKVAPFALLLPGAMLLLYLKQCDWPELFVESALSVAGLTYVLSTGMKFIVLLMLMFILPSVMTVSINFGKVRLPLLRNTVLPIYGGAYLGWCLALVGVLYWGWPLPAMILLPPAFAILVVLTLIVKGGHVAYAGNSGHWRFAGRVLEAALAVWMNSFGILVLMTLVPPTVGVDWLVGLLYFLLWIAISALGLFPGALYLISRSKRGGHSVPVKAALAGALCVGMVVMYGIAGFVPITVRVLEVGGIFSDQKADFQLIGEKLGPAFNGAGFEVTPLDDGAFVSGYVRYTLGGVRLLCKYPLENKRAAFSLTAPSDVARRDAQMIAGSHCVKTSVADLRRFTSSPAISVAGL